MDQQFGPAGKGGGILALANSLIAHNQNRMKKELVPTLPAGERVRCHFAASPEAEAQAIVNEIRALEERGVRLGDITILYRAHYVTRAMEEGLLKAQVPYTLYSGVQFYARKEVKDALS